MYVHMYMMYMFTQCLQRPERGIGFPETNITGNCELPFGCLDLNPGLLQEQSVPLTSEPSFPHPNNVSCSQLNRAIILRKLSMCSFLK